MAKDFQNEAALQLSDGGAITASAAGQVGGAAAIIDTKAGQFSGDGVFDVGSAKVSANNEFYDLIIEGSPDADFGTAANIVALGQTRIGAAESKLGESGNDESAGRFVIPFTNVRNGTTYRYLRAYSGVGGTSPSLVLDRAFVSRDLSRS